MYVKITNKHEIHNGFVYHDGLNELSDPFNDDPTQSCVPGGLYFTYTKNVHKFYRYGIYVRKISLPHDDPDFKIIKDPSGDKFRANKIILEKRYSLCDPETYKILNIKMPSINFLIECAVDEDNIDCLKILRELYFLNIYGAEVFYEQIYWTALSKGKSKVLQWVHSKYPIMLTPSITSNTIYDKS